jgi:hypothetical protein
MLLAMPDVERRAVRTQIVFDCAEPHRLAAFWAVALHYRHEEIDGFVGGLLDAGHVPAEVTTRVDGVLRWKDLASLRHPDDGVDERGAGTGRRLLFQAVPEPKSAKNRMHLDLIVGPGNVDAEVERLVGLGATVLDVHEEPQGRWVLMADPEGNEFDVT